MGWTDAEFWGWLAETMKGSGVIPSEPYYQSHGLCAVICRSIDNRLIDNAQADRLFTQLREEFGWKIRDDGYYWPIDEVASRVRACRYLMRKCS